MKAKIDLEKFICSYVKYSNIQDALKDQGLKCWNDEIVEIQQESEDERIRKTIIKFLIDVNNGAYTKSELEIASWIAWLEKQGESIKIKKDKNYLCTKTHKYAGVEWIEGVTYYSPEDYSLVNQGCTCHCPKYSKEEHNNFFKEVEYDAWLEKQAPKPKWNEEDEQYLAICKNALHQYQTVNQWDEVTVIRWLEGKLKQRMEE